MTDRTECPACDGEGMWWSFPCDVCGGTGHTNEDNEDNED